MNEPDTPAARQARQFDWLRRQGEIAMALAEAAGQAALAESRTPPDPTVTPARKSDHAQAFLAAAAAARQIIALELRVAAGPAQRAGAVKPTPPPDPRRPVLQQVLHDAVRNDPNRAHRRREIDAAIEDEIAADPDGDELIAQTLTNICEKLHIDVDIARVSDEFLDYDEPIKTLSRPRTPKDFPDCPP